MSKNLNNKVALLATATVALACSPTEKPIYRSFDSEPLQECQERDLKVARAQAEVLKKYTLAMESANDCLFGYGICATSPKKSSGECLENLEVCLEPVDSVLLDSENNAVLSSSLSSEEIRKSTDIPDCMKDDAQIGSDLFALSFVRNDTSKISRCISETLERCMTELPEAQCKDLSTDCIQTYSYSGKFFHDRVFPLDHMNLFDEFRSIRDIFDPCTAESCYLRAPAGGSLADALVLKETISNISREIDRDSKCLKGEDKDEIVSCLENNMHSQFSAIPVSVSQAQGILEPLRGIPNYGGCNALYLGIRALNRELETLAKTKACVFKSRNKGLDQCLGRTSEKSLWKRVRK